VINKKKEREMNKVEQIKQWAMNNYDAGGHWIIETLTDQEIFDEFPTIQDAINWAIVVQGRYEDVANA